MKYILDTHVWIWWNMRPEALSKKVFDTLSSPGQWKELLLSAVSPLEFAKLLEKGRLGIRCPAEDWIDTALDMPKLRLVPLTPRIAYRSTVLPAPFHDDPADQIICATAREEQAVLLTRDTRLLEYPYVRSLW